MYDYWIKHNSGKNDMPGVGVPVEKKGTYLWKVISIFLSSKRKGSMMTILSVFRNLPSVHSDFLETP